MRFFTREQLGRTQSLTPEGFLLCEKVPIARVGTQIYGPGEVPVPPGRDGLIKIAREPDEVFRPETIASFAGKPVTNDHPDDDVTPKNWKQHTVGITLNPRRGTGIEDDLVFADLLITDHEAITAVRRGKREVSAGYDAEYQTIEPGSGKQFNIVGNHVALVERGRCGPRCAIGDQDTMRTHDKLSKRVLDRIRAAFKTQDESELEEILAGEAATGPANDAPPPVPAGEGESHVHVHLHPNNDAEPEEEKEKTPFEKLDERMTKVEDSLSKISDAIGKLSTKTGDKTTDAVTVDAAAIATSIATALEGKTADAKTIEAAVAEALSKSATVDDKGKGKTTVRDSAHLRDEHQDTMARAEILMPGTKLLVHDAALPATKTIDALCGFRRSVLKAAHGTDDGKAAIESILGAGTFDKSISAMTCDAVRSLFNGAAQVRKIANQTSSTRDLKLDGVGVAQPSIRDMNKKNAEFWKRQSAV